MTATPRKRFYHFSYLRQPVSHKGPRVHELRDGDAFVELQPLLLKLGYEFGGLLLNQPPGAGSDLLSRLSRDDLVVLTTRPPITDDRTWASRKWIERTDSDLEKAILNAASHVFEVCQRSVIRLDEDVAGGLRPSVVDRAEIVFRVYKGRDHQFAYYAKLRNAFGLNARSRASHRPAHPKTTAAFLLRAPLGPGGPTLLNAFGMDGLTTLLWCYLLRTKYSRLVEKPGFTIAEISTGNVPLRPVDLSFADRWRVDLLLTPGSPSRRQRHDSNKK